MARVSVRLCKSVTSIGLPWMAARRGHLMGDTRGVRDEDWGGEEASGPIVDETVADALLARAGQAVQAALTPCAP